MTDSFKTNTIALETDRLFLRFLKPEDVTEKYINGLNDPDVNRYLVEVKRTVQTRDSICEYINRNTSDPKSLLLGVFIKEEIDGLIGTVRISDICAYHFFASIGICIFEKTAWYKGYGAEALASAKRFAFNEIGLHYLEAGVYSSNLASIRAFLSSGFLEMFRTALKYRFQDSFEEVVFMGAVNPDFDMRRLQQ
jgi:RimJ/RimL family protein N-acetyltransferase